MIRKNPTSDTIYAQHFALIFPPKANSSYTNIRWVRFNKYIPNSLRPGIKVFATFSNNSNSYFQMLIQVLQRRLTVSSCLLACIPALILSCSKSDKSDNPDPIPGYYVKFKADGKEYVIKDQQTIGSVTAKFSGTRVFSAGGIAIPGPDPAMNFVLKSNEDITPKEYKAAGESNKYPDISIHYTLPVADPVKKYESADFSAGITVTITEITKESVKGTFTANLNHQIRADRPAITDGEFFGRRTD